jgi:two-component system, cell cycle sensor histidine kinase and response regulator CckA
MDKLFDKMWNYVMHGQLISLETRFFRLITLTISLLCLLFVLPTNLMQELSGYLNLVVVLYGVAAAGLYYLSVRGRTFIKTFYGLTLVLLSAAWFLNAGSRGSIGFFFFGASILPLVFFRGLARQAMFLLLVLDVIGLLLLDYYHPGLALPYLSELDRLLDLSTGFFFSALGSALVFWVVVTCLERELKERRQAEASLCRERDRAQSYLDTVETLIVCLDARGAIGTVNRKACELLGYAETDLLGQNWFLTCLPQPDGAAQLPLYQKLMESRRVPDLELEGPIQTRSGELRHIVWHCSLLHDAAGCLTGALVSGEDITERKKAEQAVKESEERFRSFIENANDIVFSLSPEGRLSYLAPKWQEAFGYPRAENLGKLLVGFIHPEDRQAWGRYLERVRHTGQERGGIECRMRHQDGRWTWYSINASLLGTPQCEALSYLAIGRDISVRKNAELALLLSEQALRLKSALLEAQADATLDGILVINQENRRVFMNRRFVEMFKVPAQILQDEDEAALLQYMLALVRYPEVFLKKVLYLNQHPGESSRDEIEFKNGMLVDRYSAPVVAGDGTYYGRIWTLRDVTEQRIFETERLKMEKLESLGVLAGGIAHDFNNILAGIMGGVSFAQEFIAAEHPAHKPLQTAEQASVRAAELARQLITFAKGGDLITKVVSVRQMVEEAVSFALRGSNVRGCVEIPDDLQSIKADEGQISQALHNLVINAQQAMPGGGTVTLTGENLVLASGNAYALPAGAYVRITCADQGCGIAEKDLPKVFDPYFTTKSSGTGLGLASVYSILAKHGGCITAASPPEGGATFTLYLPAFGAATVPAPQAEPEHSFWELGGGAILVMDDEQVVRELTAEILSYVGFQVTTCATGNEAIALYRAAKECGAPFVAVLMDLTIPGGMGGKEAAGRILGIDPDACLIVSSGYSNDPVMSSYAAYGFQGAVSKPYKNRELWQLLNRLLKNRLPAAR